MAAVLWGASGLGCIGFVWYGGRHWMVVVCGV